MLSAFVIQIHSGFGPLHYDLMLEGPLSSSSAATSLATWQLASPPDQLAIGKSMPAKKLANHRKEYLTYEGPVSKNRGQVRIYDKGQLKQPQNPTPEGGRAQTGDRMVEAKSDTQRGPCPDGRPYDRSEIQNEVFEFSLDGEIVKGRFSLQYKTGDEWGLIRIG